VSTEFERKQQEWFSLADNYVVSARTLVNASGSAPPIVLLAWQAAENDLKALSVGHTPPFTHDIGQIIGHLRDNNLITAGEVTQLSARTTILTGSATYNATRYPESDPSYWSSLPRTAIVNVVEAAEQIHQFTQRKIAQQKHHP
jgi:HEPN domain-containing protein